MSSQQPFNARYGRGRSKCWIWPIYFTMALSAFSYAHGADVMWPKTVYANLLPFAGAIGADLFTADFKIEKMTPNDGSTNVDLETRVTVSFSEKLKDALGSDALLMKDARGNEVAGEVRIDEKKIIFTPTMALSPEVVYTVSVSENIRSQSGARLTGQRRVIFSTRKKPMKTASAIGADFLKEPAVPVAKPELPIEPLAPVAKPELPIEPPAPVAKPELPIEPPVPVAKPELSIEPPVPVAKPELSIEPPVPVAKPELPIEPPAPVAKPELPIEPPVPVAKPELPIEPPVPVAKPERLTEQAKSDEIKKPIPEGFGDFSEKVLPVPIVVPIPGVEGIEVPSHNAVPASDTAVSEAQKSIAPELPDDSQPSLALPADIQPSTSVKAPVVLTSLYHYPASGAKNTDVKSAIGVQFSKAFLSDEARIRLLTDDGKEVDGKTSYQNNQMIFEPSLPLDYDTLYTASIEGGLTDSEGNVLPETIQWSFTTGDQLKSVGTKPTGLSTAEIFVKQIVLDNNTILSEALLNPILADYENREVTANDLQQLRQRLSLEVYKQGYVNSGVVISDQKIVDGIVRLTMLQGKLSKIELSGQKSVSSDYINQRVTLGASEPLNYFKLRRSLLLLEQDPLIKRVNAKLLPGDKLGESYLALDIDEDTPYSMSLSVNNYNAPSVGSERVEYLVMHRNLLGKRDTITGFYAQTRGHKQGYFSYDIPLNVYDTQLGIRYSLTDAAIIEQPFKKNTDVESKSSAWQVKLSHPFVKTLTHQLTASAGFDKKSSEITIAIADQAVDERGDPSTGPKNVTNLWLSLQGLNRGKKRVLAWQGKLKWGMDALGASIRTDNHADGKYAAVQGNFYFSQSINKVLDKIVVRGMGQITNDSVLPTEKFSAGGVYTVRGYRENQFVRDNGVAGSIELYFPIRDGKGNPTDLTVMSFVDHARLRNKTSGDDRNPTMNQMYSIGLGVLWEPKSALQAQAFWGKALKAVSDRDENDNLQDLGFHLQLSYRLL